MELLVPAGDINSFYAGLNAGADAIYLSGKMFGARSYAKNFTDEELKIVLKLGKIYGVKIYVTMNTLVKENEVEDFLKEVEFLYNLGVDAILMQDFGMISLCLEKYPNLVIHASTQVNSSSYETIKLLYEMGVKRIVLPREMSIEEIKKIDIPVELEVFIHGALCVSYSGNCLFSSMLGSRSGNRGECVGSCRLPYKLYKDKTLINEGYLLSMKELNTSFNIKKLPSNVTSLKIEGRMKSPSYVGFITKYYRKILDEKELSTKDLDDLKSMFYRGFTKGHLFNDKNLINQKSPNHLGSYLGKVIDVNDERIRIKLDKPLLQGDGIRFKESNKGMIVNYLYDLKDNLINKANPKQIVEVDNKVKLTSLDEVRKTTDKSLEITDFTITRKIPINIEVKAKVGKEFILTFSDLLHTVTYRGSIVEKSINNPISKERLISQLEKLGNTPFLAKHISVDMDEDIFIRIGDLNIARRTLSERLIGKRLNDYNDPIIKEVIFDKITTKEVIDLDNYVEVERNPFYLKEVLKDKSIVSNLFRPTTDVIASYHLNVFNSYTAYYLYKLGYKAVTLSVELNSLELKDLVESIRKKFGNIPLIIKTKGYVEVMLIKGNILNLDKDTPYTLINVKNDKFKTYFDSRCTHINSSYSLNLDEKNFNYDNIYFIGD
mgnify:CR=1 FL=1